MLKNPIISIIYIFKCTLISSLLFKNMYGFVKDSYTKNPEVCETSRFFYSHFFQVGLILKASYRLMWPSNHLQT